MARRLTDGTLAGETLTSHGISYPIAYGYDNANRNTAITYPDGKVVTRAYTDRDQLQAVGDDGPV